MSITSVGYAGQIRWSEWASLSAHLGARYAVQTGLDLEIVSRDTRVVSVGTGVAHGCGVEVTVDAPERVTLAATAGWWTIAIRRDWTGGVGAEVSTIHAIYGSATQAVSASRETTPGKRDDQPLWLVHVSSSGAIDQSVDVRCWWGDGGMRAAHPAALAYLTAPGSVVWVADTQWRVDHAGAWVAGGDRTAAGGTTLSASSSGLNVTPAKLHANALSGTVGTAATGPRLVGVDASGNMRAVTGPLGASMLPSSVMQTTNSGYAHIGSYTTTAAPHLGFRRQLSNGTTAEARLYYNDGFVCSVISGTDENPSAEVALQVASNGQVFVKTGGVFRPIAFAQWRTTFTMTIPANTSVADKTISFPAGRFTSVPQVFLQISEVNGGNLHTDLIARARKTTSVTVRAVRDGALTNAQTLQICLFADQGAPA